MTREIEFVASWSVIVLIMILMLIIAFLLGVILALTK